MKRTIKLAVVAALALGATSAFATNGSALIATGAKARSMGGTDIGIYQGAESGLANAALITNVEGSEVSFGGTVFMPKVTNTNNNGGATESADSAADMSVIPSVSIATKVNDNFYMGIGMWGTAGMGVDYRDSIAPDGTTANGTQYRMVTSLQVMQFGIPLAYKTGAFSIGITPLLQYGALDMNFDTNVTNKSGHGAGVSQDLKVGYNLGATYQANNLTVGIAYKSKIDMEYKGQLSAALKQFGVTYANDVLSTPAEIGIGVSYVMGASTIAVDYKQIKWSDAKGYQDFAWEDQSVYALGYQYAANGWALRAGYNYAKSPISEQTVGAAYTIENVQNTLNLLGFPGIVQSHYTFGGTYDLSDKTSIDLAYVYAPEVTETMKNNVGKNMTVTHSQTSMSAQVNFKF